MRALVPSAVAVGAVLLSFAGAVSQAQAAPAASAPAPVSAAQPAPANTPTYGAPIAGMCLFARDTALSTSQAGVSANQQLQQISQTISSQLTQQRDAIAKEGEALNAQKAKLTAPRYQERIAALQQKAQAFDREVQTRNAQLSQTREKAMEQIATAVTPILVAAITAHQCSVVFERNGMYAANPAMDLTPEIVQKLNVSLPSLTVTLAPPATQR